MNFADHFQHLDPEVAAALTRAMSSFAAELETKLAGDEGGAHQGDADETAQPAVEPRAVVRAASPGPPSPEIQLDGVDELRQAAMVIDTATSQASILNALSQGVLRFASRVAIFVARGDSLHGWSADGFGSEGDRIKEVSLDADEWPSSGIVRAGQGAVALSAAECRRFTDRLGADGAAVGVLIPFVLGSQTVGTVYCDRLGGETFSVSALQLLTFLAGQTLETLPVRKRISTASLTLAEGPADELSATEPKPVTPEPIPLDEVIETEPAASDVAVGAETEPEPAAHDAALATQVVPPSNLDDAAEFAMEPETESAAELVEPLPPVAAEPAHVEADVEAEIQAEPEVEAEEEPAADAAVAEADEESTRPGLAAPPEAPEPAAPPANSASAPEPDPADFSSTQVRPPEDVNGPGWAFTGGAAASAEDASGHEEAQRLARLLVTEIKLYNEEAVEAGRESGDIYSRLQEDIDRSQQIFEDRVEEAIRSDTDYFKEALVRILGGGDADALGL